MNNKLKSSLQFIISIVMCLSLLGHVRTPVIAQSTEDGFNPDINGSVRALAVQPDGKILLGGYFTYVDGEARNYIARLNHDGSLDGGFNPNANYDVWTLAVQSDGKLLMGGGFTMVDGDSHQRLARFNTDDSLDDTFLSSANDRVMVLTEQPDGKILVGGKFTQMNEVTRNRIGRLNSNGSLDEDFNPDVGYMEEDDIVDPEWSVKAIVLEPDGKILIGGTFTKVHDEEHYYLARLNPDGSPDSTFHPHIEGPSSMLPSYVSVHALAVQADGKIVIVGDFIKVDGEPRNNIARLNQDGSLDTSFNPSVDYHAYTLAIQPDGKILIGGGFLEVGGETRKSFARLNSDGSLDFDFFPEVNTSVLSIALQTDGKILIGGFFSIVNQEPRNRIARLYPDGSLDANLNPGPDDLVQAIAIQTDGKILIGGYFEEVGGVTQKYIARLFPDGSLDDSFNVDVNDRVYALAVQPDGKILLGGAFTKVFGEERNHIARLHPKGTLDTSFTPGANSHINAITMQEDGQILVGGAFTQIDDISSNHIARLGLDGTVDTDFDPKVNGVIRALAIQPDGRILLGGVFTSVTGIPRNNIARLYPTGDLDDFNPNADASVMTIALQKDDMILVGGEFLNIDGSEHYRIARLDPSGQADSSFNVRVFPGYSVKTLALQADGMIIVGGEFTHINSLPQDNIACLNPNGQLDMTFGSYANGFVLALALQNDGKILVGGNFTEVGGQPRIHIARLANDIPALQSFAIDPPGNTATWIRNTTSPEVSRVTFEKSADGIIYTEIGAGTRMTNYWRFEGLSLPKGQNIWVRARGYYATGCFNGSSSMVETVLNTYLFQAPYFVSDDSTTFTVGTAESFMISALGGPLPTITKSGALPSGLDLIDYENGTAVLSGTPAVGTSGTYPLILTASNGVLPDATQRFTLTVIEKVEEIFLFLPLILR